MKSRSPTPYTIDAFIRAQMQSRSARWVTWIVPLIPAALTLWLMAALFGGDLSLQIPLNLAITTLIVCAAFILGRLVADAALRARARQSRLTGLAVKALERLTHAAAEDAPRQAIAEALRAEIDTALHPIRVRVVLSDRQTLVTDPERLASWVADQPIAVPVVLSDSDAPAGPGEGLAPGYEVAISLGQPGWVALGRPTEGDGYAPEALGFLHLLARAASDRLLEAELLEARHRHQDELEVLYWVAQAVNFPMNVDDLMELVYTQLQRVIRLPNFYIALMDPVQKTLSFAFCVEAGERLHLDHTWPADAGLTGVLLENKTTIRTADYVEECRRHGVEPGEPGFGPVWMGTALTAADRNVGVMVASTPDPHLAFSQAEENLFVTVAACAAAILERHGLSAQLESRAHQLTTLNEIGNLLASSLDLDEVLDLVVKQAASLLNSEAGSLLLLDEATGDLVFRISSGPAGERLVGLRVPAGKGIAGAAFAENRPVISGDTKADTRWYAAFDTHAQFITQSVIAVPLNARGRTIGVLEVVNRQQEGQFTSQDSDLLLSFASQAAMAIENARLFTTTDQALQARLLELTTLQYIDRQLNTSLDYSAVMGQTLEWSLHLTGATTGAVAALHEGEEGGPGLQFLAQRGYDEASLAPYMGDRLWPLSQGLVGYTAGIGETTLVTDLAADPHYRGIAPGMEAQLTVPIRREERVIGVIALESADPASFTEEHVEFVERLADHAAIAIDNARLYEQAQRANAAKTEFISFVSHELKQPMTSIKGYADLLIKGVGGTLNEQQAMFVNVVRNNVDRMDRMVQDLLDVSRIEAGRLKLDMGPVSPETITREAIQGYEQAFTEKHQALQVTIDNDLPQVVGDRGRLIQVLTNLISNANKYTPEGGNVAVRAIASTCGQDRCVRWEVSDDGIGMTDAEMAQLFTKYFRSKSSAVRAVQGTGLGLVITRSIIEMHGGELHVDSLYGEGTTFSFALPVSEA